MAGPPAGVARACRQAPEGRGIFPGMTVVENLEMGAYDRQGTARRRLRAGVHALSRAWPSGARQMGGTLSGGEQQMLAIGRALMAQPAGAAARRAVDGPGPDAGEPDLRHHQGDQRAGHDGPAGRAERRAGLVAGPPGLRAGAGPRRSREAPAESCSTIRPSARPTSGRRDSGVPRSGRRPAEPGR